MMLNVLCRHMRSGIMKRGHMMTKVGTTRQIQGSTTASKAATDSALNDMLMNPKNSAGTCFFFVYLH